MNSQINGNLQENESFFNSSTFIFFLVSIILTGMMITSILMLNRIFESEAQSTSQNNTLTPESLAERDETAADNQVLLTTITDSNNIVTKSLLKDSVLNTFRLPDSCSTDTRDIFEVSKFPKNIYLKKCETEIVLFDQAQILNTISNELISESEIETASFNVESSTLAYVNEKNDLIQVRFTEGSIRNAEPDVEITSLPPDKIDKFATIEPIAYDNSGEILILKADYNDRDLKSAILRLELDSNKLDITEIEATSNIIFDGNRDLFFRGSGYVNKYNLDSAKVSEISSKPGKLGFVDEKGELISLKTGSELSIIEIKSGDSIINYELDTQAESPVEYSLISANRDLMIVRQIDADNVVSIKIISKLGDVSSYNSNADLILGIEIKNNN